MKLRTYFHQKILFREKNWDDAFEYVSNKGLLTWIFKEFLTVNEKSIQTEKWTRTGVDTSQERISALLRKT